MKTIKENINNKIIINKSEFICELIKVYNLEQVKQELEQIKNKYKDATHYCYAYIINENKKSSDDGEPGGTAGVPIMETLNQYNLDNVLCIVIRYFGGIKLGAGGLVRAYRKAVNDCIKKIELKELIKGYQIIIEVPYEDQKDLEYNLKYKYTKDYKEKVIYTIECDKETKEQIKNKYKLLDEKEKVIEI